jgi:hypothetical protein
MLGLPEVDTLTEEGLKALVIHRQNYKGDGGIQ